MFALVDGNNFYVSCERVFQPRLVGKPVVVLSSNDGACIARSNEAKELGVKMAQPWFQVKHLERSGGLIAVSANHELYGDMSSRMMAVEARYAPRQEVYRVDESFLDFTGVRDDLVATGKAMRAAILQETGLPTSVGFGATKTLAKLANHIGKTADRKPGSYPAHLAQVCDFGRLQQHELDALFAATEVGNVRGVGKRITEKLKAGGIHTVLDLVHADAQSLRREFSVTLEKTLLELRGTSCMEVDDAPAPRQQILVSRSFGTAITHVDGIIEACSEFTSRAAERLRGQGSGRRRCRHLLHDESVPTARPAVQRQRHSATGAPHCGHSGADECGRGCGARAIPSGLQLRQGRRRVVRPAACWTGARRARPVLCAGCGVAAPTDTARTKLMTAMDALNHRFGRDSVRLGSTAAASSRAEIRVWATKQERRSPRFTTRWDEMPVVKA